MAITIQLTSQIKPEDGVKCLVYGPSGIGKTRLALTAPRPIIASSENGLRSLQGADIPFVDIGTYKELDEFFRWFTKSADSKQFDTLILDSLTDISSIILSHEKKTNKDIRQAWGEMQQRTFDMIREFRDMKNKHVVLICWQQFVDAGGIEKQCVPVIESGKLQAALPYFWDVILQMDFFKAEDGKLYKVFYTNDPCKVTKDRTYKLASPVEEPNLTTVFNKCTGKVTE